MAANETNTSPSPSTSSLNSPGNIEKQLRLSARNLSDPLHNLTPTVSAPPPPPPSILQRRSTLPSVGTRAGAFLRKRVGGARPRRVHLYPPISATEWQQEDGAPAQRGVKIKVEPEKILQAACAHERLPSFLPGNPDMPEYDDLSSYSISQATAKELLRREIARLVDVVENPERELRFSGQEVLKGGSCDGYKKLSSLSQRIMKAFSICELDNGVISMKHCRGLSDKGNVERLLRVVRSGQFASAPSEPETKASNYLEERFVRASFALVDYVTVVFARLVTQTGSGEYWHNNLLGVVAKWVAKVKVLLLDLYKCATISLTNAEAVLDENLTDELEGGEDREELQDSLQSAKAGNTSTSEAAITIHCHHQAKFRSGHVTVLKYIFMSLQYLKRSGLPATSYEVCAVVYETGFEGFKALLFQDRDYEFSATSDLNNLNVAHSAFSILNKIILDVQKRNRASREGPQTLTTDTLRTTVEWAYSEGYDQSPIERPDKQELTLWSMEDIVTVMVPLAVTSPVMVANLDSFRNMTALTGEIDDVVRPYAESKFDAFFRMFTSEFDTSNHRRDVLRLSQAAESGLFSRNSLIAETESTFPPLGDRLASPLPLPEHTLNEQRLRQLTVEMDEWVYDESSVVVNCGFYVWCVITAAASLVLGGLAIGFAVGNRLVGVDPFNITTYAWVLAAFVVLVCKSTQVEDWSWRDFLLRRVRCRSVSELQGVTGINEQLILAKLLHDERGTILNTRGPYNSVFQRKSKDGSGFSIDLPLNTRTMLLSGLTLLKVVTPQGHALVCLDARRGTDLKVVEHRGLDSKEHLICKDINRPRPSTSGRSLGGGGQPVRLPLTKSPLKWKGVQGVYNDLDAVFV